MCIFGRMYGEKATRAIKYKQYSGILSNTTIWNINVSFVKPGGEFKVDIKKRRP